MIPPIGTVIEQVVGAVTIRLNEKVLVYPLGSSPVTVIRKVPVIVPTFTVICSVVESIETMVDVKVGGKVRE